MFVWSRLHIARPFHHISKKFEHLHIPMLKKICMQSYLLILWQFCVMFRNIYLRCISVQIESVHRTCRCRVSIPHIFFHTNINTRRSRVQKRACRLQSPFASPFYIRYTPALIRIFPISSHTNLASNMSLVVSISFDFNNLGGGRVHRDGRRLRA